MSGKTYCVVSGSVFLVIALMPLWRFVLDSPVQIGAWNVRVPYRYARQFSLWGWQSGPSEAPADRSRFRPSTPERAIGGNSGGRRGRFTRRGG
ncbi:MAG: hypothetical protein ACR2NS_05990 [Gemmatimonadaceae bacterium]